VEGEGKAFGNGLVANIGVGISYLEHFLLVL